MADGAIKIPNIEQQTSPSGFGVVPNAQAVARPDYEGQGLAKLGSSLEKTGNVFQELDNEAARTRVRDNIFKDDMNLNKYFNDKLQTMSENPIGFTDGIIKDLTDYREKALATEPNSMARNHYATQLNQLINGYVRQSAHAELNQFQTYKVNSFINNIHVASNLAFTDPDPERTMERFNTFKENLKDSGVLPGKRAMLENHYWDNVITPYLDGMTKKDPQRAIALANTILGENPTSLQGDKQPQDTKVAFVSGIAQLEGSPDSNGIPQISNKGAIGKYQILPSGTKSGPGALDDWNQNNQKEQYTNADLSKPGVNDKIGTYYANKMLSIFGNPVDAAGAYNAGPGRMQSWIKAGRPTNGPDALPSETVAYMIKAQRLFGNKQDQPVTQQQGTELPFYYQGINIADAEEAGLSDHPTAEERKNTGISSNDPVLAKATGQQLRTWANGLKNNIGRNSEVTDPDVEADLIANLYGDPTKRYTASEISTMDKLSNKDKLKYAQLFAKDTTNILKPYINQIKSDYKAFPAKDEFARNMEMTNTIRQLNDAYTANPDLDVQSWIKNNHGPIISQWTKDHVAKAASKWLYPWEPGYSEAKWPWESSTPANSGDKSLSGGGQLDKQTAMSYIRKAGGDKEKAREMAKKDGYSF